MVSIYCFFYFRLQKFKWDEVFIHSVSAQYRLLSHEVIKKAFPRISIRKTKRRPSITFDYNIETTEKIIKNFIPKRNVTGELLLPLKVTLKLDHHKYNLVVDASDLRCIRKKLRNITENKVTETIYKLKKSYE